MSLRKLAYLTALVLPACAHQSSTVRVQPAIELRDLCNHADTASFCAPIAPQKMPLVDTNLASPFANISFSG